jgi:hypothetical protein
LIAHLLVTLAKLGTRGGLGAAAAESLAVKHQLLIMKRAQGRASNLTSWDRLALWGCALFVSSKRLSKMAVILKPSTLLRFWPAPRCPSDYFKRAYGSPRRAIQRDHLRSGRTCRQPMLIGRP